MQLVTDKTGAYFATASIADAYCEAMRRQRGVKLEPFTDDGRHYFVLHVSGDFGLATDDAGRVYMPPSSHYAAFIDTERTQHMRKAMFEVDEIEAQYTQAQCDIMNAAANRLIESGWTRKDACLQAWQEMDSFHIPLERALESSPRYNPMTDSDLKFLAFIAIASAVYFIFGVML